MRQKAVSMVSGNLPFSAIIQQVPPPISLFRKNLGFVFVFLVSKREYDLGIIFDKTHKRRILQAYFKMQNFVRTSPGCDYTFGVLT